MRPGAVRRAVILPLLALIGACTPISAQVSVNPQKASDRTESRPRPVAASPTSGRLVARSASPEAGKFLVARREMRDPNFAKTVVLLLDYGSEGALGLVINRPSHLKVSTLSPEIESLATRTDPIYVGGPVPAESLFVIFDADEPPEDSEPIFEHVHVTRSAEVLRNLAGSEEPIDFRVFAGYSGWASGQLDNELARGDWHVVEPDAGSLFTSDAGAVWESLVPPEPTRQVRLRIPRHAVIVTH